MEETYTDKEFCQKLKIDRATSLRWRELGIVGHWKMPNGGIRYSQSDIDQLRANFKKMELLSLTLKDIESAIKSRVVNIGIAKSGNNGRMAQHAGDFGNG